VPATVIAFIAAHKKSLETIWEDALTGKSQETCHFAYNMHPRDKDDGNASPMPSHKREGKAATLPKGRG